MVLEGMMDKLMDTGRCYIMDTNVENTEVINISRQSFPVQMMIEQKQLHNVEYFKSLSSIKMYT
jgi:hypothetical protein